MAGDSLPATLYHLHLTHPVARVKTGNFTFNCDYE